MRQAESQINHQNRYKVKGDIGFVSLSYRREDPFRCEFTEQIKLSFHHPPEQIT